VRNRDGQTKGRIFCPRELGRLGNTFSSDEYLGGNQCPRKDQTEGAQAYAVGKTARLFDRNYSQA
jgi:hypothetical protein